MTRAENKAERILQMELLLLAHPEGMTQAEIARHLGVHRSTIYRYLPSLEQRLNVVEGEDGRLYVDRENSPLNVQLYLHEALALHLAARLLATRMDRQNPHAAAALRKLGLALEKLAPHLSRHMQQSADVMDDAAQRRDPAYLDALQKLTLAWAQGRKVRLKHRQEGSGRSYEYVFAPYFIEPYAVGQTTHVIGLREPPGQMRTFKIERIEQVEITEEAYSIPKDFDPREVLKEAWGIWYTEAEPVEVKLRFAQKAAQRVRETQWHRSERVEQQEDGSVIWIGRVAEPREMLPWIRGWGADCEVLAPRELREMLMGEARAMAEIYGWKVNRQSEPNQEPTLADTFAEFFGGKE